MLRPDRVVHGKRLGSYRRCSATLKYEGVATSLSGVLPGERCKVGNADDDGMGVYVGHERCGGRSWRRDGFQHDCERVTQGRIREFWKQQGLRVRVPVLRERVMEDHHMVSVDLHALEIGSVLLLERECGIQSGIESRVAVAVFALLGVWSCKL